eukprot:scaffold88340_cov51-Attheya_sp.AAC.1
MAQDYYPHALLQSGAAPYPWTWLHYLWHVLPCLVVVHRQSEHYWNMDLEEYWDDTSLRHSPDLARAVEVVAAVTVVDFVARRSVVVAVVVVVVDAVDVVVDFVVADKNGEHPLVAVVQDNTIDHLLATEVPVVVVAVAVAGMLGIQDGTFGWDFLGRNLGEVDIHVLAASAHLLHLHHHWVASPHHRHLHHYKNQPLLAK